MSATTLSGVKAIFQTAFTNWTTAETPDDAYVDETVFMYEYWINYDRQRDSARYTTAKSNLILIEPPKIWQVFGVDADQEQCEIDNELSIYILSRVGASIATLTTDNVIARWDKAIKVLLEYLDAVQYHSGDKIRIFFPAKIDLVFENTVNYEIGIHAKFKIKYY